MKMTPVTNMICWSKMFETPKTGRRLREGAPKLRMRHPHSGTEPGPSRIGGAKSLISSLNIAVFVQIPWAKWLGHIKIARILGAVWRIADTGMCALSLSVKPPTPSFLEQRGHGAKIKYRNTIGGQLRPFLNTAVDGS